MISPKGKTSSSQSGITLLLSLLVLSAITAISFSLVTIMLIEIRSSGDTQRTGPALYGTLSVIEQALFKVQRSAPDNILCPPPPAACPGTSTRISSVSNNAITVDVSPPSDLNEFSIQQTVQPTYTSVLATKLVITLYDVLNPNPEFGEQVNGYTILELRELDSNPGDLNYKICQLNILGQESNCAPGSPGESSNTSPWRAPGTVTNATNLPFDKNGVYKVYITTTNTTQPKILGIRSFGPLSTGTCTNPRTPGDQRTCPKGLPLYGKKQYDVTASNADLSRRYRVQVPIR